MLPADDGSSDRDRLFLSALPIVEEVVEFVRRRRRCSAEECEEFAAWVRLRLLHDECAVLRRFGGQCSLKTYLSVVIQRLFLDFRRERWGIWRPSARARRLGPEGIRLDTLVHRDGVPLEEAIERLRRNEGAAASHEELRSLAAQLPEHRPRRTEGEEALPALQVSGESVVEAPALAAERRARALALRRALREELEPLPSEDALMLRMRFVDGFTVARIAEILDLPAKPLYRRVDRLLLGLRTALQRRGFGAADLAELVGDPAFDEEADTMTREKPA